MKNKHFELPSTLEKAAGGKSMKVGGVASAFFRDLDGEAIAPEAIKEAIPDFMAGRGPDGKKGGPICLNHNFYQQFLKQAIAALNLPKEEQFELISGITLPLGRVTQMEVDRQGKTHWKGELSSTNPIARIIHDQLTEGVISLGVSLGGKIYSVVPGRDQLGQQCTIIKKIRIDELSICQNPAYRVTNGEDSDNGAYIQALSKSAARSLRKMPKQSVKRNMSSKQVERFLNKALDGASNFEPANTGKTNKKKGGSKIKADGSNPKTGLGDKQPKSKKPEGKAGREPKTDVYGITIKQLTRELSKCTEMTPEELGSPETVQLLGDSAYGLAGVTNEPPPELVNFAKFLQYMGQFAGGLNKMASNYQKKGTADAMKKELSKALADFKEKIDGDLQGVPLRPPGSPGVDKQQVEFPQQYLTY